MNKYLSQDLKIIGENLHAFNGKTILITGATGLIGSILVKAIDLYNKGNEPGIHVIALVRNHEKAKSMFGNATGIEYLIQDICAPIPDLRCDYIIHTANSTSSKTFITQPVEVMDSIYTGSKQVLEYAKKHSIQGCVYLSSMEVFGRVFCADRISESDLGYIDLQSVRSCYSEGKRLVECMCKSYAEEYGIPVKVARLAQTFGAGINESENRVFAQFARSAMRGDNIVLHTKGESMGNYVYTRDAILAILLLLRNGVEGDVYTIVNERATMTIKDMARLVADKIAHGDLHVVFDIPENDCFGYAPDTKMMLSGAKMKALGWEPEVDLEDMYRRMLPDLV